MKSAGRFRLTSGRYVVCAKAGDPIVRPARARLIWAANTAQATHALGVPTMLAGGTEGLSFKTDTLAGQFAVERQLRYYYGVAADFDIQLVHAPAADTDRAQWIASQEYPRYVLPSAGLVHTRDPLIAAECAKRRINYIWEHHGEDYQSAFAGYRDLALDQPWCRAIVAITGQIRTELIAKGVPPGKIIVLDSGVNAGAAQDRREEALRWRRFLLDGTYKGLACYSGGMQRERGIDHILDAAEALPEIRFVLLGGSKTDLATWQIALVERSLGNIKLLGYQPHSVVCDIQQSSDVVLLTRAVDGRPNVTSPLKFFEYLASGTAIIAAELPALLPFVGRDCDIRWYAPSRPQALELALRAHFESARPWPARSRKNIETGLCYTWEARQRQLFDFIGPVEPRKTF